MLLDTYALVELFEGTKKGEVVKKFLKRESKVYLSVLSIYELGTHLEREIGIDAAQEYIRSVQIHYDIIDVNQSITLHAVEIRRENKLPVVDCLIYATARSTKSRVVSGCKHFKSIRKSKDVIILE